MPVSDQRLILNLSRCLSPEFGKFIYLEDKCSLGFCYSVLNKPNSLWVCPTESSQWCLCSASARGQLSHSKPVPEARQVYVCVHTCSVLHLQCLVLPFRACFSRLVSHIHQVYYFQSWMAFLWSEYRWRKCIWMCEAGPQSLLRHGPQPHSLKRSFLKHTC